MTFTKREAAEIITAFALVLVRVYARPDDVWKDILAQGGLVWVFSIVLTGRKTWGPVMMVGAALLSAFYFAGRVSQW